MSAQPIVLTLRDDSHVHNLRVGAEMWPAMSIAFDPHTADRRRFVTIKIRLAGFRVNPPGDAPPGEPADALHGWTYPWVDVWTSDGGSGRVLTDRVLINGDEPPAPLQQFAVAFEKSRVIGEFVFDVRHVAVEQLSREAAVQ